MTITLRKIGDFWEAFGDDARTAARVLGLTVTTRTNRKTGEVLPMAGFPYHQFESYAAKLRKEGFTVVDGEKPATPADDEPFTLDSRPKPEKTVRAAVEVSEKQRMLLEGMDALPGQLDLF